jgi:dienelactone hydrolase
MIVRIGAVLTAAAAASALVGCAASNAQTQQQAWESRAPSRAQALAVAVDMPAPETHEAIALQWSDSARNREVLARLYMPTAQANAATAKVPLVVFSHGIGGSREGYTYLGRYLAANGIAALHLQHPGSDRSVWFGNPIMMVSRLQNAAKETEAIDRARDISFALDRVLGDAQLAGRIDANRIAAAGHSYGANTTLLVAGARVEREGKVLDFRDSRIKAAVVISAPPFYGEGDPARILGGIQIPTLHITATGDEIKIPGYYSGSSDRVAVYEATSAQQPGARKMLAVFKEGSHSMFTDRLGTGGNELNPQVKIATRELKLAYLKAVFNNEPTSKLTQWSERHAPLIARVEQKL